MRTRGPVFATTLTILVLCVGRSVASPPADLASLFPPGTLAYAELVDPASVATELANLLKGSVLEDVVTFVHDRRDVAKFKFELESKPYAAVLGLLATPEMVAEFEKVRVAGGLFGFKKSGEPDFAVAVIIQESQAATLAVRTFLISSSLRRVGEVARVPIFQDHKPHPGIENPLLELKDHKPLAQADRLTYAYTPGLFVMGTGPETVGQILRRYLAQQKTPSLADQPGFQTAASRHRGPGVFFHIDLAGLVSQWRKVTEPGEGLVDDNDVELPVLGSFEPLALLDFTLNAKAVDLLAGRIGFRDGGLFLSLTMDFDPRVRERSPLRNFFATPGLKPVTVRHARGPSSFAFTTTLPEKDRAAAVLALLDALAKSRGELGRLPSEAVREIEGNYPVKLREELIGKTHAVTVFIPTKPGLPAGAGLRPVVVLHAETPAAAEAWQNFMPWLLVEWAGAKRPAEPVTEKLEGVTVYSVPGTGLPGNAAVHFARNGSVVAVGLDSQSVARATTAEAETNPELSLSPETVAYATINWGELARGVLADPKAKKPPVRSKDKPMLVLPDPLREDLDKSREAVIDALANLPPTAVALNRSGHTLRLELFQAKPRKSTGVKDVVDALAVWLDKLGGLQVLQDYWNKLFQR